MAMRQINNNDIKKAIKKVIADNSKVSTVIYNDGNWSVRMMLTRNSIRFIAAVRYKSGKTAIDNIIVYRRQEDSYRREEYLGSSYRVTTMYNSLTIPSVIEQKVRTLTAYHDNVRRYDRKGWRTLKLKDLVGTLLSPLSDDDDFHLGSCDNSIIRLIQDREGYVFLYIGKYKVFSFRKKRAGSTIKTGLPGENDEYLVNVTYRNKHIYIPILSKADLERFDYSIRMGTVKFIEEKVKQGDIAFIKALARDEYREESYWACVVDIVQHSDWDFYAGHYDGKGDSNELEWYWQLDEESLEDGGESVEYSEAANIHW